MRRRSWSARVPVGPILLVVAAALVVVALRSTPGTLDHDLASVVPVVVAATDLAPGAVVGADDVEVRAIPVLATAATTAATADEVVGRQVTAPILRGEPLVSARLAPEGLRGVAAATPPGWSAFALAGDAALPVLEVGQVVDLYASPPAAVAGLDRAEADPVARGAVVVAVDDLRLTVAVRGDDAAAVAGALIGATVVVAVAGPVGPAGTVPR